MLGKARLAFWNAELPSSRFLVLSSAFFLGHSDLTSCLKASNPSSLGTGFLRTILILSYGSDSASNSGIKDFVTFCTYALNVGSSMVTHVRKFGGKN